MCWPSDLNYLKFVAAKLQESPKWTPDKNFKSQQISVDLKKKFIAKNRSHLICHENYAGFYVPVSFQDKHLPEQFLVAIGSSIDLRSELKEIADKLKLNLGDYTPDFGLLFERREPELRNDVLIFEKFVLLYLYNMALASIRYNLIIQFS